MHAASTRDLKRHPQADNNEHAAGRYCQLWREGRQLLSKLMDHGAGGKGDRRSIGREVEPIERDAAKDRDDRYRQGAEEPERREQPRSAENSADQDEMDNLNMKGPCRHKQDG